MIDFVIQYPVGNAFKEQTRAASGELSDHYYHDCLVGMTGAISGYDVLTFSASSGPKAELVGKPCSPTPLVYGKWEYENGGARWKAKKKKRCSTIDGSPAPPLQSFRVPRSARVNEISRRRLIGLCEKIGNAPASKLS